MFDYANSTIDFTDGLLDINIDDFDLSKNYMWWKSTQFRVNYDHLSKYFMIQCEFEISNKNLNRIWRFSKKFNPWKNKEIEFSLRSIVFVWKDQYFWLIKLSKNINIKGFHDGWYMYNPSIWGQLSIIREINAEDRMITINENDYENNMSPWIIVYSCKK